MNLNRRHDDPAMTILRQLLVNQETIMSDLSDLQAAVAAQGADITALKTTVDTAETELAAGSADLHKQIDALKAQLAAGGTVSAADLQALKDAVTANDTTVQAITASVKAAAANLTPLPVPPAA